MKGAKVIVVYGHDGGTENYKKDYHTTIANVKQDYSRFRPQTEKIVKYLRSQYDFQIIFVRDDDW